MTASPRWMRCLQAVVAVLGVCLTSISVGQGATPVAPAMSRPADASNAPFDPALKRTLESRIGSPIDAITRLPIGGLYEVQIGSDVVYTDATGNYLIIGNVIDTRTRENITRARVAAIKQESVQFKFADLPFAESVKVVKGSGKRKVAIFEDPNCGYCKLLEKSILDIGDVTIYVFLYPVLGPDSLVKSKQVWCAADRGRAWTDWMQKATALSGDGACATPLDRNLVLGRKLKVEGTPTMFFSNNKRVEGTVDTDDLERLLAG